MTTIVYCLATTAAEQAAALHWQATTADGTPTTVAVVPHLINTTDEQRALRTISNTGMAVIALQIIKPSKGTPHNAAVGTAITYAELLPRTIIGTAYRAADIFCGTTQLSCGLEVTSKPGDRVLLVQDLARLKNNPAYKCCDQTIGPRIKDTARRRAYERGLPYIPPATEQPSCTILKASAVKDFPVRVGLAPAIPYDTTQIKRIAVRDMPDTSPPNEPDPKPPARQLQPQPEYPWMYRPGGPLYD